MTSTRRSRPGKDSSDPVARAAVIETLGAPVRARARRSYWRLRPLKGIGYATPVAVMVGVFFVLPLGLVFWMSANRWRLLGSPTFNFPDNYARIAENQLFLDSIVFTLKYTAIVTVVLSAIAMGLALLVQEERPGTGFLRTVYFLPGAVGFAAASLLFYGFYAQDGPLDDLLQATGLVDEPVRWLGTPNAALFSTIAMVIWRFAGFNMLILLTGLQAIPTDVYEAARHRRRDAPPALPPHHAAAAAPDDRADARAQHHRLAAGLRPVLHHDPRRAGRQHDQHGDGHLPRGVHALRPRLRGRASRCCCSSASCCSTRCSCA